MHLTHFACSLFVYVVSGLYRPLLIRGDTYQKECIYTGYWSAIDFSSELSPSELLYTFVSPAHACT